ncbi:MULTISPECIES: hypothetical protein [Paracoccus]|uniref:hypothetical protein n=1 Tax=Paracoccus TaxID=265 RepID=UPI000A0D034E|nr:MULTISPECIES: hypothetical protein [Paracoccus]SMG56025.1 hypothetical protein SAMN02746000_03791 [Paracoccus sp. J56]
MFRRIAAILRVLAEAGLGYALFALGGLAIGVGVQMGWWLLAVLGIAVVLAGFWLIGL